MNEETTTIVIDNALATGSVTALDPEERKLQELALALRADAPVPDEDFALRMNARVSAGFPRRKRIALPRFAVARPRFTAIAAAASLLIALVIGVSLSNRDNGTEVAATSGGAPAELRDEASAKSAPAAPQRAAAGGATEQSADSVASSPPIVGPIPPTDNFVGGRNRRVQRSAALTLAAPEDDLSQVGDQVIAVTDRYRGFVMRSTVTSAADGQAGGSFDLRIPVRTLRPALRDLSGLADVKSRTENADDVTASFVNARTRLEELNAERRGLLRRLEKAITEQQAGAIRARIRLVNVQIESAQSSLKELQRRTSYASVSVSLVPKDEGSGGGGGGISDGARDFRDSLVDSANVALRVLGVALPIGLVLGLLIAGNAWATRRRREAALDA